MAGEFRLRNWLGTSCRESADPDRNVAIASGIVVGGVLVDVSEKDLGTVGRFLRDFGLPGDLVLLEHIVDSERIVIVVSRLVGFA